MIFIHELGHYLTARMFHVTIREFAIGMGPRILHWTSKKTGIVYALRLLPIGGFVSMVGEDESSEEENALNNKPVWQRMIITAAGSIMNLLLGFLLMFVMVASTPVSGTTIVADFDEGAVSSSYGLQREDEICAVNGTRVHNSTELLYEIMRNGIDPLDLTVLRDGEELVLPGVVFPTQESDGSLYGNADFVVYGRHRSVGSVLRDSFTQSVLSVRMIWESLFDLLRGRYGLSAVTGPVGTTKAIGDAVEQGSYSLLYMCAMLAVNLGIFNLLPIPAMDGGRLFFQLIELIRRKPVKPEVEGYIHFAGIILLLALMALVTFKDIIKLVG